MGESGDILNEQLCDAVLEDDIERANKAMVDLLLKRGASINETGNVSWLSVCDCVNVKNCATPTGISEISIVY